MVDQRFVDPIEVPRTAELSQAVRVGNLIFCSGQIGIGPDGKIVDPRDTRAQIVQAFKNLKTVHEGAGESLDQVVKITSYLLDDPAPSFHALPRQLRLCACGSEPAVRGAENAGQSRRPCLQDGDEMSAAPQQA